MATGPGDIQRTRGPTQDGRVLNTCLYQGICANLADREEAEIR
jgi:hypothetical protein